MLQDRGWVVSALDRQSVRNFEAILPLARPDDAPVVARRLVVPCISGWASLRRTQSTDEPLALTQGPRHKSDYTIPG